MKSIEIDHHLLDELVSGSLRGERYRQTLLALESHPERWRDCALAFLQEQAIEQELQALAASDINWEHEPIAGEVDQRVSELALQSLRNEQLEARQSRVPVRRSSASASFERNSQWLPRLSALAAMLVLSFGIGWLGSSMRDGAQSVGPSGSGAIRSSAMGSNALGEGIAKAANGWASNPDFWSNNPALSGNSSSWMPIDRQVPPSLVELERTGRVRIESFDALVPVDFEDGTSAIVPVQQFRVVPVVYSY